MGLYLHRNSVLYSFQKLLTNAIRKDQQINMLNHWKETTVHQKSIPLSQKAVGDLQKYPATSKYSILKNY
jgi:hypothetical protein